MVDILDAEVADTADGKADKQNVAPGLGCDIGRHRVCFDEGVKRGEGLATKACWMRARTAGGAHGVVRRVRRARWKSELVYCQTRVAKASVDGGRMRSGRGRSRGGVGDTWGFLHLVA